MSDPVDDFLRFLTWLIFALLVACVLMVSMIFIIPKHEDKRLYTVEVNGARYENLTFVWGYKTEAEFVTQDGKRITVHGTFVMEQQ